MEAQPAVAIYRRRFLQISETFIADHITSLRRWRPVPIAESRVPDGLVVPGHAAKLIYPERGIARGLAALATERLGLNPVLGRLIGDGGVKLIHTHFLSDSAPFIRIAQRYKTPLVVTAHGYDATVVDSAMGGFSNGPQYLRRRDALIETVSAVICVSNFIRQELLAKGFPAGKLLVQPLGIDLTQYRQGAPAAARRGVVFAGRLVEKKGASYLIRAWALLPAELRAQGLTMIGGGPEAERLRELASGYPEIRFLGQASRVAIMEAMSAARVFAFPSTRAESGDAEGMGIVAMEAQALGLPVLAFDEGPMREVMAPDVSGLVTPSRDIKLYAEALAELMSNDDFATRLGNGGPAVVRERFDLVKSSAALENIYDKVAG
jgi:colanic acid/amylovoran biosynthesis glycosyltransferase